MAGVTVVGGIIREAREDRPVLAVAGASGFVGTGLARVLGEDYDLVGLTREPDVARLQPGAEGYRWRRADLFSRRQTVDALEGTDVGVYLIHSLEPSAKLTQGEVGDLDLICADNFARAAQAHGVRDIVYLRPLRTERESGPGFLASRGDVASTLAGYGAKVTTLETTLVLGPGATSVEVLRRLVTRLPAMILPAWADKPVAPIDRAELSAIIGAVVADPEKWPDCVEVGGPEVTSFRGLLEQTAEILGRRRWMWSVGPTMPRTSSAWMSTWTGVPRHLVRPMVESLRADRAPIGDALPPGLPVPRQGVAQSLELALNPPTQKEQGELVARPSGALAVGTKARDVRAVHRVPMPSERDATWVAAEYGRWLPHYFRPFIDVVRDDERNLEFYLRPLPWPLLRLEFDHHVSRGDRHLYWIRGGLLARPHEGARLEFRLILQGRFALGAIHEFWPRLPWPIYLATQARIHHFVMTAFGRHLARMENTQL